MKKYIMREAVIGTVFNDKSVLIKNEGWVDVKIPHLLIDAQFLPDIVSSAPCTFFSRALMDEVTKKNLFLKEHFEEISISTIKESPYHGIMPGEFKDRVLKFKYFWIKKYNDHFYINSETGKTIISQDFKNNFELIIDINPDNELIDIEEIG